MSAVSIIFTFQLISIYFRWQKHRHQYMLVNKSLNLYIGSLHYNYAVNYQGYSSPTYSDYSFIFCAYFSKYKRLLFLNLRKNNLYYIYYNYLYYN